MSKMVYLSLLFFLCFLNLTGGSQESVEHLTLHNPSPTVLQSLSHTGSPIAVSVGTDHLSEVSNSVISAENWVRTHVLSHYPATKITTIVVGNTVFCNKNQLHQMGSVLPSVKNIFHSLTRWGLEREIKVSASLSSNCLNPSSEATYKDDFSHVFIKPLLNFLQKTNSTYLINPPPDFSLSPEDTLSLVSSHTESMKNIGVFNLNQINVLIETPKETKPMSRKLSSMDSDFVEPFPARPTPLGPANSPSIGYSVPAFAPQSPLPPAFVPKSPLPPLIGTASPPSFSLPLAPKLPPVIAPSHPPYGFNLPPPCSSFGTGAPPGLGAKNAAWCVAKPNVPTETLQEAMDYACGDGGGDCEAIKPQGNCYAPDTVVAHASYAFNSYWQKNKRNGGTCSFGGTAMLINADPSFQHCQFIHT
ncbi:hypothetical protein Vadar_012621 [Vaccinium darrowii]|uniref:Uncharacterized protein n=1 Tax=Vaccinium darrowii TaxID=229202 RepID=A0ACB7YDM9_9ERIC|nr:hypothetical protein Vadar_012621 [Vaccinium darrowii]